MTTYTDEQVRARARRRTTYATAASVLTESVKSYSRTATYDVFLCHSVRDAEIVLGVKLFLEDHLKSVYVDWIEDPLLDRSRVTARTAEAIRGRMRQSRSLIYIHTANSPQSKWMPWELGFSDGIHGAVAILPITNSAESTFNGQEYLGIYPWIDQATSLAGLPELRVHGDRYTTRDWRGWIADPRSLVATL